MHKKLEAELVSLAHSILQMKNKDDVNAWHTKAQEIQEKLAVLKFVDTYFETSPNIPESKKEIIDKIQDVFPEEVKMEEIIEPRESIEKSATKEMIMEE